VTHREINNDRGEGERSAREIHEIYLLCAHTVGYYPRFVDVFNIYRRRRAPILNVDTQQVRVFVRCILITVSQSYTFNNNNNNNANV